MEAPDKIYVSKEKFKDGINWNQQRCDDIEYIRKDILSKWAKELRDISKEESKYIANSYFQGCIVAYGQLIEKLESL